MRPERTPAGSAYVDLAKGVYTVRVLRLPSRLVDVLVPSRRATLGTFRTTGQAQAFADSLTEQSITTRLAIQVAANTQTKEQNQ